MLERKADVCTFVLSIYFLDNLVYDEMRKREFSHNFKESTEADSER